MSTRKFEINMEKKNQPQPLLHTKNLIQNE